MEKFDEQIKYVFKKSYETEHGVIPEGTEIYYKNIKDENYTGVVVKNNKVKFPGFKHPMTVSDIAGKLEGGARNGYKFFYYKNKSLEELRPTK